MTDLCPVAVAGGNEVDENQPETACESYLQALKEAKLCDVIFTFENCEDRIEAHQLILRWRSPVFFAMFRGQGANVGKTREVEISGVSPQRFQEFLEFMYVDKFEVNIAGALDLLHLAHKYRVNPLIKKCEELLKIEIKVQDAVQVFETARKYQHADLEQKAGDVMAKNLEQISQNDDLLSAEEETLAYLLQRDHLTPEEVDLFRFVVKWGENKLKSAPEPADLKTVLANLLPLVRFTNMTLNEFASEVVPLNLLAPQETIAVYSYFASDEVRRQDISALLNFSTKPRKSENMDRLFRFYMGGTATSRHEHEHPNCPLKECLSFFPIYEVLPKPWHNHPSRKPAITGILIHSPTVFPRCAPRACGNNPNFKVSVKWCGKAITDQSVELKFQKEIPSSPLGQETEISVEPSVELISGVTYCITVEDQCSYFHCGSNYCYWQRAPDTLNESIVVPLKKFSLQLRQIERNTALSGFARANVPNIRLIQGIRISMV